MWLQFEEYCVFSCRELLTCRVLLRTRGFHGLTRHESERFSKLLVKNLAVLTAYLLLEVRRMLRYLQHP